MRHAISASAILAAGLMVVAAAPAKSWTLKILYNFTGGTDGSYPNGLIQDPATGNLYGTTYSGGAHDDGTLFKISKDGTKTILVDFSVKRGARPWSGPNLGDAGNLFGTTSSGAHHNGVVYKYASGGAYTTLHRFAFADGRSPEERLHLNRKTGDLYGTTIYGGAYNYGTVFRLAPDGSGFTVLHEFSGGDDGEYSSSKLVMDAAGNLYGTTARGGHAKGHCFGCGTIFMVTPQGQESVLHAFAGKAKGSPNGDLILDRSGNLYGTVSSWGNGGALFRLSRNGQIAFLHQFSNSDPAGVQPRGHIVMDRRGAIYGSTAGGGPDGGGTVYQYTPDGNLQPVAALDHADTSGVVQDSDGNLYGTMCCGGTKGYGTVFEVVK